MAKVRSQGHPPPPPPDTQRDGKQLTLCVAARGPACRAVAFCEPQPGLREGLACRQPHRFDGECKALLPTRVAKARGRQPGGGLLGVVPVVWTWVEMLYPDYIIVVWMPKSQNQI